MSYKLLIDGALIERPPQGAAGIGGPDRGHDRRHDLNHHLHFAPHVRFPGAKQSGLGVEFGREGLAEFSQMSVVSMARGKV